MDNFGELHAALQKMTAELVEGGVVPLSDDEMATLVVENMGVFYNHLPPIGFRAVAAIFATLQLRS